MLTNRNRIEFDGQVVRRYPLQEWDRQRLHETAQRQERARRAGLPVPAVLAVHARAEPPYMVMQRCQGTPLMETDLSRSAQVRLGEHLAGLAASMRAVCDWPDEEPTWAVIWEVLARVAPTRESRAAAELAAVTATTLVHGDLSGGNLLVGAQGDLEGVLDWDGANRSDPAMDWAALCANCPPAVVSSMRRCTPAAGELDRRAAVYLATWPLQHDLWRAGEHPWLSGDVPLAEPRL